MKKEKPATNAFAAGFKVPLIQGPIKVPNDEIITTVLILKC